MRKTPKIDSPDSTLPALSTLKLQCVLSTLQKGEPMKKLLIQSILGLLLAASARAGSLSVEQIPFFPTGGPCWDDVSTTPGLSQNTSFTLPGVTGTGTLGSASSTIINNITHEDHIRYVYALDLSGMTAAPNHCITVEIHFGTPLNCTADVLVVTNAATGVSVTSANLSALGDITYTFGGGCINPGQAANNFEMISDASARIGSVTIIDNYQNLAGNNVTNQTVLNVSAVVPDIPPDWAYLYPIQIPNLVNLLPSYQGILYTNPVPLPPPPGQLLATNPPTGVFNFRLQFLDGSNGLPVTPAYTQAVQVVNGLFNTTLPFDPDIYYQNSLWLNVGVSQPQGTSFTPIGPPAPITPVPQAFFAYSAGVVADISSNQAVTSLNGLTGQLTLAAGSGIVLDTTGNTLTISAASTSDRNVKTDFGEVDSQGILAKLVGLPIESWRYTNEVSDIRHIGPMAQDFKAAFGLGHTDKYIGTVDEEGVALAAIQALNQKLQQQDKEKDGQIESLKEQNQMLEKRLSDLEQTVKSMNQTR